MTDGFKPSDQGCPRAVRVCLLAVGAFPAAFDWRHEAEVDVHRLERFRVCSAGDVAEQRAERGFGRRGRQCFASQFHACEPGGEEADGSAFKIAFAAGDLSGKADVWLGLQAKLAVEESRRVDEAVAVDSAEPRELGIFEARDGSEYAD